MVSFLLWAWQHENVRSGAPKSICGHEGNAGIREMEPGREKNWSLRILLEPMECLGPKSD